MAQRKRIGLFYESYRTLPAYVIYIQNLVRTLYLAEDKDRPVLVILHLHDSPLEELTDTGYPYLEFYCLQDVYANPLKRAVNKVSRLVSGKNLIEFTDRGFPKGLDAIFPYNFRKETEGVPFKLVWKPDFQEFHLPQFFESEALKQHGEYLDMLSKNGLPLVLSSEDSKRDYENLYPHHNNQISIWRFTSFLPDFSKVEFPALKQRHKISKKYFVVANQFWPHKNHLNVLKAVKEVVSDHKDFQVVITGKQSSSRDGGLFSKLLLYIQQNRLEQYFVFTGFIHREEQLCLMKNAEAVIQPSLFEGWSTVIEDCKAMGQQVLASHISVNKEQIKTNVLFFDPYDYQSLAGQMKMILTNKPALTETDYRAQILAFRDTVLQTFNDRK